MPTIDSGENSLSESVGCRVLRALGESVKIDKVEQETQNERRALLSVRALSPCSFLPTDCLPHSILFHNFTDENVAETN